MADSSSQLTAVDPDLEAGQVVGEYEVEAKIGQGGFGAVFKAVHPLIGKVVAIKVLARKFSVDPEMVSRFVAEAKAVNQIRNRHIIDIFSFGQLEDGRHYYVMEYLDGEPLDALLDREGKLPLAAALPILRAIARALDAAHAKGIAHRDLKPENVFLASDDGSHFPKLLDFGIAKLMTNDTVERHKTRTGIPIGTPHYMSPEQSRGKDVDHRTDYYAFGVLAYRMLTGVLPIDGEDYMDILMKQIAEEPSAPSTIDADLAAGIDDAIAWLMKKAPALRPPSLIAAVRAIEASAEGSGIAIPRGQVSAAWDLATPVPGALRAPTSPPSAPAAPSAILAPPRAKRTWLVAAAIVAAAGVGAAIFLATRGGDQAPRAPAAAPVPLPSPPPSPSPSPSPSPPPSPSPSPSPSPQVTAPAPAPLPAKKPKPKPAAPSRDSHSYEDPFGAH